MTSIRFFSCSKGPQMTLDPYAKLRWHTLHVYIEDSHAIAENKAITKNHANHGAAEDQVINKSQDSIHTIYKHINIEAIRNKSSNR